jgi:predicted amidophosphoribosyltransferase
MERCVMRNRHFPRLCRTCQAPMARQLDTCWRCGAQWVSAPAEPALTAASEDSFDPEAADALRPAA